MHSVVNKFGVLQTAKASCFRTALTYTVSMTAFYNRSCHLFIVLSPFTGSRQPQSRLAIK